MNLFHKDAGIENFVAYSKQLKTITELSLSISPLTKHQIFFTKLRKYSPTLYKTCFCGNEIETYTHYLLQNPTYINERMTLLNELKSINCSILEFNDAVVTKILIFRDNTLSGSCNTLISNSTIDYIISTKRFDDFISTPG